jgi:hypothetical protein
LKKGFALVNHILVGGLDLDKVSLDARVIKNFDQKFVSLGEIFEVLGSGHHDAAGLEYADGHVEHLGFDC